MKKAEGKNGAKGWLIALGVLVGLVLIAGIAYAWDVAANQDKIPRAVSVNGVDISAMDRTAAVAKLEDDNRLLAAGDHAGATERGAEVRAIAQRLLG